MARMDTLAIIGGGAAGLACAVAATDEAARLGVRVRVVIYEADERVGRSILATGNGRCNFSNTSIDPKLYRNAKFVEAVLGNLEARVRGREPSRRARFAAGSGTAVLDFFADLGLVWREEDEGRLYPQANKASVVLDVLRAATDAADVEVRCNARVERVEPPRGLGKPFTLRMDDGAFERASAVVVACGGRIARSMLSCELAFRDTRPVLGPLATDVRYVRQLDNIRVRGALELWRADELVSREEGEVMFRKYGVSGIAAFNLSRHAKAGDKLAVDFLPRIAEEDVPAHFEDRRRRLAARFGEDLTCGAFLRGLLLPQVAHVLLESIGASDDDVLDDGLAEGLARCVKRFLLDVQGPGDVRQCQVSRGGLDVAGFDVRTLETHVTSGLYAAGEALDVDAPCGGYNLHWAWASGLLSGRCAVEALGRA